MITLETPRLTLRPWYEADREPFFKLNCDPQVMEYFPNPLTRKESDASLEIFSQQILNHGFGFWVMELKETKEFMGITGVEPIRYKAHFTPAVQIGWRLATKFWGKGFLTEAALKSVEYAFEVLKLPEIVSVTVPQNFRSRSVMERIGMNYDPQGDFDHPKVAEGPCRRHVLYRLRRS